MNRDPEFEMQEKSPKIFGLNMFVFIIKGS